MGRSLSSPVAVSLIALPYVAFAELNGAFNAALYRTSPLLFWAIDSFFNVALPAYGVWFLARCAGIEPLQYGFAIPPPLAKELIGASLFFATILYFAFFIPERIVWAWSGYPTAYFSYSQVLPSGLFRGPAVLYMAVTAGLVESAVYIGLPWLLWRQFFGNAARGSLFACASSAIFASVHWEQGAHAVLGALVFGYIACKLYLRIGDLWPIVGAHAAVDVVAFW